MTEIYWLQRLANVSFLFNVGFWFCIVVAIFVAIVGFFIIAEDDLCFDEIKEISIQRKKYIKTFVLCFAFFTLGAVMTPTEKELMAIYGIGGTIDYIKSNDKAKQLPDKCVDALMRYVDSIENDNNKKD